jgi:serine/threonine protein kinase
MISNKYKILDKLSSGNFGVVYKGENIRTNEHVAIKIIKKDDEIVFKNEILIYKTISKSTDFAKLKWVTSTQDYYIIVLTLLGNTIQLSSKQINNQDFIKKLSLQIFQKIINLHSYKIIHRDIKTNNFVSSIDNHEIFLIDFSFSTFIIDECGDFIPNIGINNIIGSKYFCSLNIHKRNTPSFRDDLESACYVINDIIWGNTWKSLKDENEIMFHKENFYNTIQITWLKELYLIIRNLGYQQTIMYPEIETYIISQTT